jgi:flagellar biosynthesis protein FlhG
MPDQAEKLRQLIADALPDSRDEAAPPPMIVVTGAKGGVGTTTIALNLAVALTHAGHRTVLVDAAQNADIAQLAGADAGAGGSIADVVEGMCDAEEALCEGPGGVSLLAGSWAPNISPDRSPQAGERLLRKLQGLQSRWDVLVVDAGTGITAWTRAFWRNAAIVLVVTTPDDVAVLDAYATMKRGAAERWNGDLRVLVNQCNHAAVAADVQDRLAGACRRFLQRTIGRAPRVPEYHASAADESTAPRAWDSPTTPFARAVHQLGRFTSEFLAQQRRASNAASVYSAREREYSTC